MEAAKETRVWELRLSLRLGLGLGLGLAQTAGGDAREEDAVKHTRTTPTNTIAIAHQPRNTHAHTNALLVETRTSALTLYGRTEPGGGVTHGGRREVFPTAGESGGMEGSESGQTAARRLQRVNHRSNAF